MAAGRAAGLPANYDFLLRFVVAGALIVHYSRPYLDLRPSRPIASIVLGVVVFLVWIGPDVLFGYRHFWLFENSVMGKAAGSIDPNLRKSVPFLALRIASAAIVVPILEELFWRGWLMRWLIVPEFLKVKFGEYRASAFWMVAVFFALEHGSYWEVGLAAGVIYNWWAVRTRCIGDCIVAHG